MSELSPEEVQLTLTNTYSVSINDELVDINELINKFVDSLKKLGIDKNTEITQKNKEIQQSIEYAKRIQKAILPPQELIAKYLSKSFVLYKPKDIVAGDFYWMQKIDGKILFSAIALSKCIS